MRTVMHHLSKIWAALVLLPCAVAGECIAAPPLEIYGRLPEIELAAMSPSGKRVAIVGIIGGQRRLAVLEGANPIFSLFANNEKLRTLAWADDDNVLLRLTATVALGAGFTAAKTELSSVIVAPMNGNSAWSIFDKKATITGGVFGDYGIISKDGRTYGYFGGVTLDRTYGNELRLTTTRPDLYQVNFATQESRILARRIEDRLGYRDWLLSAQGKVAATMDFFSSQGDWAIRNEDGTEIAAGRAPLGGIDMIGLSPTGDAVVYYLSDPDTLVGQYLQQPLSGGQPVPLLEDESINELMVDPRSRRLLGFVRSGDSPEQHYFDERRERAMKATRKAFSGLSVTLLDANESFDRLLVQTSGTGDPQTLWTVDIGTGNADALGSAYPLSADQVGPVSMLSYNAGDGLKMSGVLTLPPGREARNLPLIMLPHGGPAARDYPVFDWWAQAFASRGYAVFQPNFRGSTGIGASFRLAGRNEWGRKMQSDLTDGLAELARQGIVDPKRACIVGGSYGGYAALAGVTLQQGFYRCAVSVAGVGDVVQLAIDFRRRSGGSPTVGRWLKVEIGTGRDLKQISPITYADRADAPILLIHGKDDIVVPFSQSNEMATALKRAGKPVEFVTLAGVDHWLSKSETRLQMLKASVEFVEKHNPPDPAPAAK